MTSLCVALPGGALFDDACRLLDSAGVATIDPASFDRTLCVEVSGHRFVKVRPTDIPVYVEMGACDCGIVGKDVLWEDEREKYELVDLRFGGCRLVLAAPRGSPVAAGEWPAGTRVATKYPRSAARFLGSRGLDADLIKLHGSLELAPAVGLVDAVVDLTATGRTLAANGLVEVAELGVSSARLIVNPAALKTKFDALNGVAAATRAVLPPPHHLEGEL